MNRLLCVTLFLLAIIFTANGTVLAQAQPQLVSLYREGALPVGDPLAQEWDAAPALNVSLIPQAGVAPALPAITIASVRVQSFNDGKSVAFRVGWDDKTASQFASRTTEFRDAVAIQFPLTQQLPNFCMGAAGQMVNVWHWKADWQYDIDKGFRDVVDAYPNFWLDYYPLVTGTPPYRAPKDFSGDAKVYLVGLSAGNLLSNETRVTPVEDLNGIGFGTLTSQANQDVQGRGVWKDGKWYVVFTRAMSNNDKNDVQLKPGQTTSVAFAAWDGADNQVGARKQLSTWTTLEIRSASGLPAGALDTTLTTGLAFLGLGVVLVIGILYLRFGMRK
jgi:hypothetical protein